MERKLSVKDGCAMQFDGKDNYHQVSEWNGKTAPREEDKEHAKRVAAAAEAARAAAEEAARAAAEEDARAAAEKAVAEKAAAEAVQALVVRLETGGLGVSRVDWKLETMHGKNVCDPLSNMPKRTLNEAIGRGDMINVGTHEVVLYLARHRPTPEVAKLVKDGWWTVGQIFYAYYDHRQFTALNVPKAVGFSNSHECHLFAGLGKDVEAARLHGPLAVRGNVCACPHCTAGNFDDCEMAALLGPVRRVKVPREQNATASLRQMESLQQWAASLKKGQLASTQVAPDEACIEGLYWLVLLLAMPYTLEKDTIFNTDSFEKGDLVVKVNVSSNLTARSHSDCQPCDAGPHPSLP